MANHRSLPVLSGTVLLLAAVAIAPGLRSPASPPGAELPARTFGATGSSEPAQRTAAHPAQR